MECCRNKRKFSLCTLIPKTKEDRNLFWVFRRDDIVWLYPFYFIFPMLMWLSSLYVNMTVPNENSLNILAFASLIIALLLLNLFIGRRYKNCMIYCIPVIFTIGILGSANLAKKVLFNLEKDEILMGAMFHSASLAGMISYQILFFSPNLWYMLYYILLSMLSEMVYSNDLIET